MDEELKKTIEEAAAAVDAVHAKSKARAAEHAGDSPADEETDPMEDLEIESGESGSDTEATAVDASAEGDEDNGEASEDLSAELDAAREEARTMKDRWLRAVADHENYKKRTARDTADQVQRELQRLLNDFLPVADNLDRALEASGDRDDQLVTGIKMVRDVFFSSLEKNGITPLATIGETFDPNFHEALQQMDSPEFAPGQIAIVFERGYLREGRLMRPAKVVVAGPGSTGSGPGTEPGEGSNASDENPEPAAEEV